MELELQAGKTYVFKSEEDREAYLKEDKANQEYIDNHYRDGFTVKYVDWCCGFTSDSCGSEVISYQEIKYFRELSGGEQTFEQQLVDLLKTHDGLKVIMKAYPNITVEGAAKHMVKSLAKYAVDEGYTL